MPPARKEPATHARVTPSARNRPLTDQENEEFARVLGVSAESLINFHRTDKPAVADLPNDYDALISDPIKSSFAHNQAFFYEIKAEVVLEMAARGLPDQPAASLKVVDIGCGPGEMMKMLAPHFEEVCGCDPAESMVRRAGPTAVHMTSLTTLPFEDDSFDIAVCACVYHHIEPHLRPAHLQEIRRILRPNGLFMVFEHNRRNPLTRYIVNRCPIDASANLLYGSEMRGLMAAAGFARIKTRYYLFLPQLLYQALGWIEKHISFTRLGGQYCVAGAKSAHPAQHSRSALPSV